jgi:replicative DNA helicase
MIVFTFLSKGFQNLFASLSFALKKQTLKRSATSHHHKKDTLLKKIGHLVYEHGSLDTVPKAEQEELFANIDREDDALREIEKKIASVGEGYSYEIPGSMDKHYVLDIERDKTCESCKTMIPINSTYCPHCGKRLG